MEDLKMELTLVRREISGLQETMKQQTESYTAERRSSKKLTFFCYIFLVIWLIACSGFLTFVFLYESSVPEGTITAWIPDQSPPEGTQYSSLITMNIIT